MRAGDEVLAYDHASGRWRPRVVTAVHDNVYEDTLVTVTTDEGAFRATVHHPVWVVAGRELEDRPVPQELSPEEDRGQSLPGRWVDSHHLHPGDVLIGREGGRRTVLRLEMEHASALPVFNLTVDGDHTYAVGDAGLLVHNTCFSNKSNPPDVPSVGHHSIPREIQKKLPEPVKSHPDVRGRRGNPNIRQVDPSKHVEAHDKTGISRKQTGIGGGIYNLRFQEEIRKRGGYNNASPKQINEIRDQLMKELDL